MFTRGACGSGGQGWIGAVVGILAFLCAIYGSVTLGKDQNRTFVVEVQGEGPPILLIPGLNSSGKVWRETVEHLEEDYECHVLTLAGFGGTKAIGAPFLSRVRESILSYIEEEELERPMVVGHSLGGFLALWLGASAPEAVGGVVTVDGVPFLPALLQPSASVGSSRARAEQMRSFLTSQSEERLAEQARMSGLATGERGLDLIAEMARQSDPAASGQAVFELMTTDLRPELSRVTAPTLLVGAGATAPSKDDLEVMRERYESQIAAIPNHRLVLVEEARHFIMLDTPGRFLSTLETFLEAWRQGRSAAALEEAR